MALAVPLLDLHVKCSVDTCTPVFIAALSRTQVMNQLRCLSIDFEKVTDMHNGVILTHQEEQDAICRKMDGTGEIMLSKINQAQKDEYCLFSSHM